MKAYSLKNLAADLQGILFDSFDRPWKGGPKFGKRVNRIFFLFITQILGKYGTGTNNSKKYIKSVKEQILEPLAKIYPLSDESKERALKVEEAAGDLFEAWPKMEDADNFWKALANLLVNV